MAKKKSSKKKAGKSAAAESIGGGTSNLPILTLANIDDADRPALNRYCQQVMGLNPRNMEDAVLKGKIKAFLSMHADPTSQEIKDFVQKGWDDADTVFIVVGNSTQQVDRGKAKSRAVYVNFNGHEMYLPRNQPIRVPTGVCEILNNSIGYDIDAETKERIYRTEYPYTVVNASTLEQFQQQQA